MIAGVLLAAGAGRRMGRPKALVDDWLVRSVAVLRDGGCDDVLVVLGAAAEEARALLPGDQRVAVAEDWEEGMGASLRVGLSELSSEVEAALVHLVDLPDVGADVVARVVSTGSTTGGSDVVGRVVSTGSTTGGSDVVGRVVSTGSTTGGAVLARAAYRGVPGHPVLIGRDHWAGVVDAAVGDQGARGYLSTHDVRLVECGDLAGGDDVDRR